MPIKIILAGEGGQGVQTVAKVLALSAQKTPKNISYIPSFGVEQRGGVSLAFVQISSKQIPYPRFAKADIMAVFCERAVGAIKNYLQTSTIFIYDNSAISEKKLAKVKNIVKNYLAIPAQKIAQEKYSVKAANMLFLGALLSHLKEISFEEVEKQVLKELEDKIAKKPEIKEKNLGALREGLQIAQNFDSSKQPFEGMAEKDIQREFKNDKISWTRFPEYCKGCGLCIVRCPVHALSFSDDTGFLGTPLPAVDLDKCTACGNCQRICPDGAIKVEKQ